ncbi:palmitoyl-acyl carrier protein thioesterase [Spatholobus suberectus]|nr:palmitoyl-acyl carrier protein thioesterase [Spatholobus suberectus]
MAATEKAAAETEAVSSVKCYCCGLTEECTSRYIDGVRERYQGRWICGLCAEAVKEEGLKDVSTDEALKRHMKFRSSTSSPPNKPTLDLILAVKHLLFRSLDSPRKDPLTFSPLARSRTCFSPVSGSSKGEPQSEAREVITSE